MSGPPVIAVVAIYMLYAIGLVPHMVFFVDFIARGLGWGVTTGAGFWAIFGIGAILGPFAAGWLGDRISFARALTVALVLQLGGVLIPLLAPSAVPLALSALVMGAFTPGMPTLVLGRLAEIASVGDQHGAWGLATTPSPSRRPPAPTACRGSSPRPTAITRCLRSAPWR